MTLFLFARSSLRSLQRPAAAAGGKLDDIYGTKLWGLFSGDPQMVRSSLAFALTACTDGASPFKRGKYTFWPVVFTCMNLPAWLRFTLAATHLAMIIPGPYKPKDYQPYLDIIADELVYLYWHGVLVDHLHPNGDAGICHAMLIQWIGDHPALAGVINCTQASVNWEGECGLGAPAQATTN